MPQVATEAFVSDSLDEMCCGTVELGVPLRGDVIQIGVGGDVDVGRIRVSKSSQTVTVTRVDGRPMQVVDVAECSPTARVFDEPVRVLILVRTGGRWVAAGSDAGASPAGIARFADVVGTFAAAQQRRTGQWRRQHSHRG